MKLFTFNPYQFGHALGCAIMATLTAFCYARGHYTIMVFLLTYGLWTTK